MKPIRSIAGLPASAEGKLPTLCPASRVGTRAGHLSGVSVVVALVRVCFLKNAGLVIRQYM
jgi:hypothetical protein